MKVLPLAYEVAHCSSWDDDHGPEKLVHSSPGNRHYTTTAPEKDVDNVQLKGWQTPKGPSYPQDLIIHLLGGPARITKIQLLSHHFKIATKVDIYVGLLKESEQDLSQQSDDDTDTLIEFTRLGYIGFDDNARTQFRARELKSIKINADGEYIRLVVRNNHQNHLNVYNQVGLLTLNIVGQPLAQDIHQPSSSLEYEIPLFDESNHITKGSSISSDDDYQSQIYELSASGMMELELQHWMSSLLHAESLAVKDESYQKAKTYKQLSDQLSRLLQLMVAFEQAKRQALDTRDYDEAEKIKSDIIEIKQAAESMIKQANLRIMDNGQVLENQGLIDATVEGGTATASQDHMYDEAIAKWTNFATCANGDKDGQQQTTDEEIIPFPTLSSSMSAKIQERRESQAVTMGAASFGDIATTFGDDDKDAMPEAIMDEERATYRPSLDVFGESTVACVLDMKSKCRERGLHQIQQCIGAVYQLAETQALDQLPRLFKNDAIDSDDLSAYLVNATLMMFQEAIMDSREPIVSLAIQIWQQLNDFYCIAKVDAEATKMWTLRAFSGVLRRTGDANLTIRSNAVDLVLKLSHTQGLLDQFICQPERIIHNHKEALSRIQLVQRAVDELKLQQDGGMIVLDRLMEFIMAYLYQGHEDVQQQAMQLLLLIGSQVEWSKLEPLLDEATRHSLQSKLQKKTGSSSKLVPDKDTTVAELRALTVHGGLSEEKKQPLKKRRPGASLADKKKAQVTTKKPTVVKRMRPPAAASTTNDTKVATTDHVQGVPEDTMCIFCDENNPQFNEQTLITHYYKNCPALTNCPMCQIILEVSTLQSHTATDCEKRHLMKQCTRCKQSIPVEQWLQHTLKATCSAYTNSENETRCPLCLVTIEPGTEEGWRAHLLTGGGCPKNPRGPQHRDNMIAATTPTKKQQPSSDKKQQQPSSIRMKPSSLRKK
ncbi:hypothetical protein BCR42DRAFT_371491 [Absidia repens]|uniref:TOG domain-containing protein n=1 Tax=Absidia repens TaxID=90262 RepID=A0A1X2IP19_9FUNG|nr:hypothetical protein BCR42DRAFT_371491 [Absidia repens]